ncbi:hypothetical protein [Cerasicoccus maritimus]|uniref:hypothetical protein n=1 Tax=Cerasicoccus maritimus TaxID=490089 RepID=UPI0028527933|nr:hypothetical protein [Cerasicoccus maritimus]
MNRISALLFGVLYFGGAYAAIWFLIQLLNCGDPALSGVGIYYAIWIIAYLPMAIIAGILLWHKTPRNNLIFQAVAWALAIVALMACSLFFDLKWPMLILEYTIFGLGLLITRITRKLPTT